MANKVNKIRVVLTNVRLSFANIFEPKGFNGSEPRYSASFLISKQDNENINKVREAIKAVAKLEWNTDVPKFKENQLCLRDGDGETWGGYADHFFVSSGNKLKVAVRDLDGTDLTKQSEDNNPGDKPLSGDYVNAVIEVWAQNNNYGKRINANLVGVQYVKTGSRFSKGSEDDLFADTTVKTSKPQEANNPFEEPKKEVVKPTPQSAPAPVSNGKLAFGSRQAHPVVNNTTTEKTEEEKEQDEIDKLFN